MKGSIGSKHDTSINLSEKQTVSSAQLFTYLMDPSNKFLRRVGRAGGSFISNNFSSLLTKKNQHSNFLYVYFWYAYYLLLVPFRFERERGSNNYKYELYQWRPQQILCGFSNILSILKLATTLRSVVSKIQGGDPISFFMMFCECSSFIFKITVFRIFWTKSLAFKKLINFLSCPDLIPYNPYKMESIKTITVFCGAYTVLSFLRMFFGSSFINYWDWSPVWLYRRLVAEARYTFFISNSTSLNTAPTLSEINQVDTFIAIIQGLSVQSRFITGFFVDLCILVHVLSLWAPSSAFTNYMHSQVSEIMMPSENNSEKEDYSVGSSSIKLELEMVLRQFETLKTLSILIGESIGDAIMPYIGEALFYYAIYFDSVVMTPDVVTRLVLMFFYISAICILMFSAEIVRQMRWFKTWLGDQRRLDVIDQNQLAVTLDDLAQHTVGVTASGVFTINYPFVGTVVSVLITYFIIRLQTATIVQ